MYEKNLRLARSGRAGEFSAWFSQPDIDLNKEKVYRLIHEHATRYDLPLPWQLKERNGTESYHSVTPGEVNPLYGTKLEDPRSNEMKDAKQRVEEKLKGREFSTVARVDFQCDTVEMKDQLLTVARTLGLKAIAPKVHAFLCDLRDRYNRLKSGLPSWLDFGATNTELIISAASPQAEPTTSVFSEVVVLDVTLRDIVITTKESSTK
jgi:hypothetical protein